MAKRTVKLPITSTDVRVFYMKHNQLIIETCHDLGILERRGRRNPRLRVKKNCRDVYWQVRTDRVLYERAVKLTFDDYFRWCEEQDRPVRTVHFHPVARRIEFVFTNDRDAALFKLFHHT